MPLVHRTSKHGLAVLLAMGCGGIGLTIAWHYPIAHPLMAGLFVVFFLMFYIWHISWLVVLPAMLPLMGLAPWTGWLSFEELDVLVLAVAAAGYTRLAVHPAHVTATQSAEQSPQHRSGLSALAAILVLLFSVSLLVAMFRGFADAGGFSFGWFQGYHEPMNSVRLGKSFFEALLLLPLWLNLSRQSPERAMNLLSQGLMLGLAGTSLATVWERLAFTGLLNFSTDYRTTGLFWEMHVGGAALDGFLALTVPFALRELAVARTPARWSVAATVLALAAYACLTTFSRGVYLAIPVGVAIFFGLNTWRNSQLAPATDANPARASTAIFFVPALWLVAGFGIGAAWLFQSAGYRGMAALLGAVALMLPLARVLRDFNLSQWVRGAVLGAAFMVAAGAIAWLVPKGAYWVWGTGVLVTVTTLVYLRRSTASPWAGPVALAGFLATVAGVAWVENHWEEAAVGQHAAPVLLVLLSSCVAAAATRKPLWPDSLRWQATTVGCMGMVAAVIGIFGGGSYMGDRFSTTGQDFGARQAHWQLGIDLLRNPSDWWLGKGLGRFPANYFLAGTPQEHPGDYRLKQESGNNYLTLTGGLHINGWGEMLRVTQRVAEPGSTAVVTARVRADKDLSLHFEVCEKHLLYGQGCTGKQISIQGSPGVWQSVRVDLQGDNPLRGNWYAPRLLAFSMAMASRGGVADLDNVTLTSVDGHPLLANGDFANGMAHWFFSSDRYHLPWHIKSVFMNVLFDQGVLGLALWSLLLVGALWRTSLGMARRHPLAPALAASLSGFLVVGLFDSLLDVPRLGWVFYLLLGVALTLQSPHPKTRTRTNPKTPSQRYPSEAAH